MHFLIEGPKRFCELEKFLDGISTRTLTIKLSKILEDGMIAKKDDGSYSATKKGKGLKLIEDSMRKYEKKYM
jgi:DNA-binding HxlR family transcriptional regulator